MEARQRGAGINASPLLDPDHWAVLVARRLDMLGVAPDHLPAQRAVPLHAIDRAVRQAEASAIPEVADQATAWRARLEREFPGLRAPDTANEIPGGFRLWNVEGYAGAAGRSGAAAPGLGVFEGARTGALPLSDRWRPVAGADVRGNLSDRAGFRIAGGSELASPRLSALDLTLGAGGWAVSVGRERVGYGTGMNGGVVLNGSADVDRIQLETTRPLRFPPQLGLLGHLSFNAFLGRLWDDRHPGEPYLGGGSLTIRPHPRLVLAVHRAAMFAGDRGDYPLTIKNLFNMAVGRVANVGFEDQIVSVSTRLRLPTERLLPLTGYIEWGAEDAAGAWWDVPGRIYGLQAAMLPGLPGITLGIERATFPASCCANPPWYRHGAFIGSWAIRDEVLAHPVGGDGSEVLLFAQGDIDAQRLSFDLRGFARSRGEENLFSPGREGRSAGVSGSLVRGLGRASELRFEGSYESGSDWSDARMRTVVRHYFR